MSDHLTLLTVQKSYNRHFIKTSCHIPHVKSKICFECLLSHNREALHSVCLRDSIGNPEGQTLLWHGEAQIVTTKTHKQLRMWAPQRLSTCNVSAEGSGSQSRVRSKITDLNNLVHCLRVYDLRQKCRVRPKRHTSVISLPPQTIPTHRQRALS